MSVNIDYTQWMIVSCERLLKWNFLEDFESHLSLSPSLSPLPSLSIYLSFLLFYLQYVCVCVCVCVCVRAHAHALIWLIDCER